MSKEHDETYNGWTNYETWSTYLYMAEYFYEIAEAHVEFIVGSNRRLDEDAEKKPVNFFELVDLISDDFDQSVIDPVHKMLNKDCFMGGLVYSLLRHDKIDWFSIAEHTLDSVLDSYDVSERPEIER
jgi:hypothetical protein